ncbi:hypothetical protein Tco_0370142 [Tanacetum coccineum]
MIPLNEILPYLYGSLVHYVSTYQPNPALTIPEPVLVDEDEDPEEEEFNEGEEPQKEEDMDIDGEEDENKPELMFSYEETDPLNPPPPASDSEPEDMIKVEDMVEPEDETVPNSVSEMAHALVEKKGKVKDNYYGKLIADFGNEVRSSVEEGTTALENLVRKFSNIEERAECKKLKKELEEARLSNTLLHMQNEQVERDLYWTRIQAHGFYQEMIRKGVVFKERPNEAINVPVKDEESPSSEPIMPPKSAPLTQASVWRMIKESVDAAITSKRARQANTRNNASGSRPAKGQVTAPVVRECTFAGLMKCNPDNFRGTEGLLSSGDGLRKRR